MEKIVALCKRRGFIFQSSEIYGGLGLDLRLRPLRRAAEEQRQGRVVAGGRAGARRHGGARRRDPDAPAHVGGVGPRRELHRPARAVHGQVQEALARGPPRARRQRRAALPRVRRRAGRRAPVQPDVRDLHGPRARGRGADLPAPRDRAGHLRQLQERAPVRAPQAAVRHRPDRQGVPQRDHARQLHLPHARVRADGDRVLRAAAPRRREWHQRWMDDRMRWYTGPRHPARPPAAARARRGRAVPLLGRHERHRVPVPDGLVGAGGHRQ